MNKKEEYKKIKKTFEETCEYLIHEKSMDVENYLEVLNIIKEELTNLFEKYKDKMSYIILIEFYTKFENEYIEDIRRMNSLNIDKDGFSPRLLGMKTGINVKTKKTLEEIITKYGCKISNSSNEKILFNQNLNHQERLTDDMKKLLNMKDLFLVSDDTPRRYPELKFEHDNDTWNNRMEKMQERKEVLEMTLIKECGIDYKEDMEQIVYLSQVYYELNKGKELIKELHATTDGITLMGEANMELYFDKLNSR